MQFNHIHFGSSSVPPYIHTTGLGKTILRRHEGGEFQEHAIAHGTSGHRSWHEGGENHEGDEDHSTSFIFMESSS